LGYKLKVNRGALEVLIALSKDLQRASSPDQSNIFHHCESLINPIKLTIVLVNWVETNDHKIGGQI